MTRSGEAWHCVLAKENMTYEQIRNLSEKEFKRLCGVKPQLFEEMVGVLRQKVPESRKRGGQPKLSTEDYPC